MYRQFHLRHSSSTGQDAQLICWLRADNPKLQPGALVTLKDDPVPDRYWEVKHVFGPVRDAPPDTRWRVGGLL
jgi:hypothetical protein